MHILLQYERGVIISMILWSRFYVSQKNMVN